MQVPVKTTGFGVSQKMPGDASGKKLRKGENLFVKIDPSSRITDEGYTARLGTHFDIKGNAEDWLMQYFGTPELEEVRA